MKLTTKLTNGTKQKLKWLIVRAFVPSCLMFLAAAGGCTMRDPYAASAAILLASQLYPSGPSHPTPLPFGQGRTPTTAPASQPADQPREFEALGAKGENP